MTTAALMVALPWTDAEADARRFRVIVSVVLMVSVLFSVAVPLFKLPDLSQVTAAPMSPRLAKLLMERPVVPPLPPKVQPLSAEQREAVHRAQAERRKRLEEAKKPRLEHTPPPLPKPSPTLPDLETQHFVAEEQRRAQAEAERLQEAQRRAAEQQRVEAEKRKGTALAQSVFGDLAVPMPNHKAGGGGPSGSGNGPLIISGGKGAGATPAPAGGNDFMARAAANAGKGSGGIDTGQLAQAPSAGRSSSLSGRQTTRVEEAALPAAEANDGKRSGEGRKGRSRSELGIVFERYKAALYSQYQRVLRKNPTLAGKVVVELTIAADGKVSACRIVSSDIDDPEFLDKLVIRIQGFDFGAKAVETITVNYPLDFFPDGA